MKKVLVVDDDPDMAELIAIWLTSNHYEVECAGDGREGLEQAGRFHPDLVIMDLLMPGMHGFELCQAIRSDDKLKDVRIIVVSGKHYQVDFRASDRLGANLFLMKPFQNAQLLESVVAMIGRPGDPLPHLRTTPGPG